MLPIVGSVELTARYKSAVVTNLKFIVTARDILECDEFNKCGPDCNCTNTIGSYYCTCFAGYRINNDKFIASYYNPCRDIDECSEQPGLCGQLTVCTNVPGTFDCSCCDGTYPSTGIYWEKNVSFCESIDDTLNKLPLKEGETKEDAFCNRILDQLTNDTSTPVVAPTVSNAICAAMLVGGVGPYVKTSKVSSEGNGRMGSQIIRVCEGLVNAMATRTENETKQEIHTPTVDMEMKAIGTGSQENNASSLTTKGNVMHINLMDLASANNGSVQVAFMTVTGMESFLSHQYFKAAKKTEMRSDVVTALVPSVNITNLTEPVNFTIQHTKSTSEDGTVSCVYWNDKNKDDPHWSEEGCWVSFTHENYTVCSCTHLSTFALIMQIGEPAPQDDFLEWLNRICVIIGLFFFALAILTFILCSWNPKINNTARLHLCLTLGLSHLLLLWNDRFVDHELACTVMAGLLHYLVVSSFTWMLLEALQLHLLVRRLNKVQVIQRDGLPKPLLYMIGYGVPFVIVGVSALVYSDGYGATKANVCWLSTERHFNWALTGPVIAVLGMNWMLFCATLWSLRHTLASMRSGASQSKDTRLILFKILAQFVILGCTWILGLYQTNLFFQVLFIILNSQQGTFLFIVHCLLNKEVREEYVRWLTCAFGGDNSAPKDLPSVSEDLDNNEGQKEKEKKAD
ncbi:adhesion G protein-coupled receptor E3-like [Pholidichthys leucotaenia]